MQDKATNVFFSDMVTASGQQIDRVHLLPQVEELSVSKYNFPREEPTASDWVDWTCFWTRFTHLGLYLVDPLGRWTAPTHRSWSWFYDAAEEVLQHVTEDGVDYHHKTSGRRRTRGEQCYEFLRSEAGASADGRPASISRLSSTLVRYLGFGPPLASGPSRPEDFWEYLRSWGGQWMWDGMEDEEQDLQWLVSGLVSGTIVCVTDGWYDRKIAPNVSDAGILLCCTKAKRMLRGNFYEDSKTASSYRGELLGLVAIHTILLALCRFYNITSTSPKICCDNIAALRQSGWRGRRVKTGASQADCLRVLRTIKMDQTFKAKYQYVSSHQDCHKLWWQLSLVEQLNCVCNGLAKAAVTRSLMSATPRKDKYLLPLEHAAVYVGDAKSTTDVSAEVRHCLGKAEARAFYTAPKTKRGRGLGWSDERFDQVEWGKLAATLDQKPDMYGIWLSKQSSGTCATRHYLAQQAKILADQ